jgi:2-amino-4-hydroxy-6-hydroxymethyldihydropteridine diphosphokinase
MRFDNNCIFIGLGSNLGDCRHNLVRAINLLEEKFQTRVLASSIFRSEPVEVLEQPWFLNQVVSFTANDHCLPTELLAVLKEIEREIGRQPGVRYGPRLIDLDLLFFKNWVFESFSLTVPHPKITERSFVLMPMLELDSGFIHPRLQKNIAAIYHENSLQLSGCERCDFEET